MKLCLVLFVSMIGASIAGMIFEPRVKKYEISTIWANWWDAGNYCRSREMRLVSILSEDESDLILVNLKKLNFGDISFWTSGTCTGSQNRQFRWLDIGKKFYWTNWAYNRPNNITLPEGPEECVEVQFVNRDLKFYDRPCTFERKFICEQ